MKDAEALVRYIIGSISEDPDCFHLTSSVDENGCLLLLSVDKPHMGRVIGRKGVTAQAMRELLRALGLKNNHRYHLKIEEWDAPNG